MSVAQMAAHEKDQLVEFDSGNKRGGVTSPFKRDGAVERRTDFAPPLTKDKDIRVSGEVPKDDFVVVDTGERAEFTSGMVRNKNADKLRFNRVLNGPMFKRWAAHLQKGAVVYPDVAPGVPNWTLANDYAAYDRFRESLFSHVMDLLDGKRDEDHAAAIFFNVNGMEYTRDKMIAEGTWNPEWDGGYV